MNHGLNYLSITEIKRSQKAWDMVFFFLCFLFLRVFCTHCVAQTGLQACAAAAGTRNSDIYERSVGHGGARRLKVRLTIIIKIEWSWVAESQLNGWLSCKHRYHGGCTSITCGTYWHLHLLTRYARKSAWFNACCPLIYDCIHRLPLGKESPPPGGF